MGATYTAVRDKARSQSGVFESPENSNRQKYGVWYGWNGVPWCAIYISWVFYQAGALNLLGGKTASVRVMADRFRAMGRYGATPRVGALAIYSDYSHISLVTAVGIGTLVDISGNTSSGAGSIGNGGVVAEKQRSRGLIIGYCYPAYTSPVISRDTTRPPVPTTTTPKVTPTDLVVDGDFGPKTKSATNRWTGAGNTTAWGAEQVKDLQRKVGSSPDGVIGPRTIRAWQRAVNAVVNGQLDKAFYMSLQRYLNAR